MVCARKFATDITLLSFRLDEPEEVTVVKKALLEHLDMDSKVTLGVLCDQLVPIDEPMDEEEKAIRDRLGSLVLAFIAGEAKRAIIERHASRAGNEQEQVLIDGLVKALSRPSIADASRIVRDILLSLPSFKGRFTPRGDELLQTLLSQARVAQKDDLGSLKQSASVKLSSPYLKLADFVVKKGVADPIHLLRFYFVNFIPKMIWQRFSEAAQLFVIIHLAESLSECTKYISDLQPAQLESVKALQRQVADASSILLPALVQSKPSDVRAWNACAVILRACLERQTTTGWHVPSNLARILEDLSRLAQTQGSDANVGGLEGVIRSLLQPPTSASIPPKLDTDVASAEPSSRVASIPNKRKADDTQGPLPMSSSRGLLIQGHASRQPQTWSFGSVEHPRAQPISTPVQASTHVSNFQHPLKRSKTEDATETARPSLLSRMNPAATSATGNLPRKPAAHPPSSLQYPPSSLQYLPSPLQSAPASAPFLGISIKGAAKAAANSSRSSTPPKLSSLLDRMKDKDLSERIDEGEAGRKRKWKGKV
ncbi:hypothetical protein HETIRDRAFT_419033 [Heterobasidion irregulare TC 32-1]|uniref:Uncharacterized protein n=1 Tax=Heterobasidion irregulare (strain TC 32-1) TaxID=747525 RepID=W4K5L6_HETIT|nr:uncharacterized protein HETIRDRAFT_419033 [Heterobasidion irregulare TC 32-1]ETW81118.1 hypothetical protein HETIRDRAFT_419033 [Heterobasidion irregulare TC 32-1]